LVSPANIASATPPLSLWETISVSSRIPLASRASTTLATPSSIVEIIAA
jgi:hypothetical protein